MVSSEGEAWGCNRWLPQRQRAKNIELLVVDGRALDVDLEAVQNSEKLIIDNLYEHLMAKARQYEEISELNPNAEFTGRLVLEGDREIPFKLLKKILYTCGQAGFINQSLAVFQKE